MKELTPEEKKAWANRDIPSQKVPKQLISAQGFILAAGLGTRLGEITQTTPKPMVEVAGKPVLGHIFEHLLKHGVHPLAINLHHLPLEIIGYMGNQITYSPEQELMGTAGALKKMEHWFKNDFVVVNGDTITNVDIQEMLVNHKYSRKLATVFSHEDAINTGGVYVFNPDVLKMIPQDTFYSIKDDLMPRIDPRRIAIHRTNAYYYDIGTPEGLEKARNFFGRNQAA